MDGLAVPEESIGRALSCLLLYEETVGGELKDVREQGSPRLSPSLHLYRDETVAVLDDEVGPAGKVVGLRTQQLRPLRRVVNVGYGFLLDLSNCPEAVGFLQVAERLVQEEGGPDEPQKGDDF